uniref:Putative secreted protein n=1 Tax=Anopheles darlingi TaxID=43151 RepID=A0A2M4D172_ANODA
MPFAEVHSSMRFFMLLIGPLLNGVTLAFSLRKWSTASNTFSPMILNSHPLLTSLHATNPSALLGSSRQ